VGDGGRVRGVDSKPFGPDRRGERRQFFDIASRQTDFEPGRRKPAGNRRTDARTRPDDQRGAIGKVCMNGSFYQVGGEARKALLALK
jgi:hypothetical protein